MPHLFVSDNQFSGPLPETLADCPKLENIGVSNNNLSGIIPAVLASASEWRIFRQTAICSLAPYLQPSATGLTQSMRTSRAMTLTGNFSNLRGYIDTVANSTTLPNDPSSTYTQERCDYCQQQGCDLQHFSLMSIPCSQHTISWWVLPADVTKLVKMTYSTSHGTHPQVTFQRILVTFL